MVDFNKAPGVEQRDNVTIQEMTTYRNTDRISQRNIPPFIAYNSNINDDVQY